MLFFLAQVHPLLAGTRWSEARLLLFSNLFLFCIVSVFMRCQLSKLQRGQMIDEWFPLSSYVPLKGIEPGTLRVRVRYSMEKIMPEEEYSEFKEVSLHVVIFYTLHRKGCDQEIGLVTKRLLVWTITCVPLSTYPFDKSIFCWHALTVHPQLILQRDYHVIYALAHVCGQDRTLLASILLRILRDERAEAPLLRTLNDREINMEGRALSLYYSQFSIQQQTDVTATLRLDSFLQACSSRFSCRTKLWQFCLCFLYSPSFQAMNNCLFNRLSNQTSSWKCAVCSEKSCHDTSISSIDSIWYVDEFTNSNHDESLVQEY